ncbi:MAG: hypothetical protein WCI47_04060 [bacterium]
MKPTNPQGNPSTIPSAQAQPTMTGPVPRPGHNPLHVTAHIEDDVPQAEPNGLIKIGFFLGFIPILGYIGLGIASFEVMQAKRTKTRVHGLVYATIALQLFYTLFVITALTITYQVQTAALPITLPVEKAGQNFLRDVKDGNFEQAKQDFANELQPNAGVLLPVYRTSITSTPLMVYSQSLSQVNFVAEELRPYNGSTMGYQLWRVGGKDRNLQFMILVFVQIAPSDWRVVQAKGLEAAGDASAKSVAVQDFQAITGTAPR